MTDKLVNKTLSENLPSLKAGGFPINSLYILELPIFNLENGFPFMREYCSGARAGAKNSEGIKHGAGAGDDEIRKHLVTAAENLEPDILGLKFNIEKENDKKRAVEILQNLLPFIRKPLMIRGAGNDELDKLLLPELAKTLDREAIIASANENTYKTIVPFTKEKHYIVLRSPIDINLAKEINILSHDLGQPLDKIIIDTDIGGLGYGFEYGYSIIEKIKLEENKDKYLSAPIISFACEEALKTKETKSTDFSKSWGSLNERIVMFEIAAASAVRAAGADLIVINHPETLKIMKGLE